MPMIKDVNIPKVLREALRHGGELSEVFYEETLSTLVSCEDNRIEKAIAGQDIGAGVRLVFKGRTAYAYTNDISQKGLLEAARVVSDVVKGKCSNRSIRLFRRRPPWNMKIKIDPQNVPLARKIAIVKRANSAARKTGKYIKQAQVAYRDSQRRIIVFNSKGVMSEDKQVRTLLTVMVVAGKGDIILRSYETAGGLIGIEIFDERPPENVARTASERALKMLSARKAPGGTMPVVLSSSAGGTMIHEAVGHGLEADHIQEGTSVYKGKIGKRVASRLVTVLDDATIPGKRGSFSFDDEGVPAQRTILIENGILKGYIHSLLTAMKDAVLPTGNGRRESYQHRPIPRMSNIIILPGKSRPDAIVKSVERGLLVKKMGGGQVNTVTGDFIFEVAEGYLIEKGKQGEPVRGATLTGSGPRVIEMIDMVGSDLDYGLGTCGKDGQGVPVADAQPTLRIPELVVGGEVR